MSIEYIRKTYGLAVKIGDWVTVRKGAGSVFDGRPCKIIRADGPYLVLKGATWRGKFHPGDIEIPALHPNGGRTQ